MVSERNLGDEYVLVAAGFDDSGHFYESLEHEGLQSPILRFGLRFRRDRLYSSRHNSTEKELDAESRMVIKGF